MKPRLLAYGILLLIVTDAMPQNHGNQFWNFNSIDGEVRLKGLYRQKYSTLNELSETQQSAFYSGGFRLNTKSHIWHPNFLKIDLGGEFFPESDQDDYLVNPDRAEVRTLKGLNIATVLFNEKPFTLSSWANWNDSYSNRENLTDIRSKTSRWGSSLLITNNILPANLSYNENRWNQTEIQSGRTYQTEQNNFDASTKKTFSWRDRNELSYSHNRYFRNDANISQIENISDNIRLNNNIILDKDKKYVFRSMIYNYHRQGSQNFNIFSVNENLNLQLPQNLRFNGNYSIYNHKDLYQESKQNKLAARLRHRLFSSLHTSIFYEYSDIKHTLYRETRNMAGFNARYSKKIPTGQLFLSYNYSFLHNNMNADPVDLQVFNEEHILTDGDITLLDKAFVDENTILVKDVSGTIIYQEDFDYLLIPNGNFMEIQRIPGGQIANGSRVYVDYVAILSGAYRYNAINNNLTASLNLFKRFLEIYYKGVFMDYRNVEKSDLLTLNYLKGNTLGAKIRIWHAEIGAEYEHHNSTITPYKLMWYSLNIQKRFEKIILSVYGNWRDYDMLEEQINRVYADLSAKAIYEFTPQSRIDLILGYRHQEGPGINLNLLTAGTEFKTVYRKLYFTLGLDLYKRDYLSDQLNYYSIYLELSRRF